MDTKMKGSISKVMDDIDVMIDLFGRKAVLSALSDIAGRGPVSLAEKKGSAPLGLAADIAGAVLDGLMKAAGGAAKGGARVVGSAIDKSIDQDVHISSQGPVLKVTDPALVDLITQTNSLIKKTHELLMGASSAIEDSNKELGNIDDDMDDWLAIQTPGTSTTDVKVRQAAGMSPGSPIPPEEEPEEPEEERV